MAKASKTEQIEDSSIGTSDLLKIYKKHSSKVLSITTVVFAIIIAVLFYTNYTSTKNNDAWSAFSKFKQETSTTTEVSSEKVQEILSKVEGSSAEPWVLFYCSALYFKNRDFQNSAELNNRIFRDFKNEDICVNKAFYQKINDLTNGEIEWLKAL